MIHIKKHERGLLFRRGDYVRCLLPGSHYADWIPGSEVTILDTQKLFKLNRGLSMFAADNALMNEMQIIDVPDGSLALHFVNGHFTEAFAAGQFAYWNATVEHKFKIVNQNSPEIPGDLDATVIANAGMKNHVQRFQIDAHQVGLLFFDGVFIRQLKPGAHYFWQGPVQVQVTPLDLRQLQIDMTGQEILTLDRVSIRINFVCHYRIINPERIALQVKEYEQQLYVALQLILREYVGTLTLDELLQKKEEINQFVLSKLKERSPDLGVEFNFAGVKDIILPGDFKEIMNLVLIAERKAQANLLTRREEIASTRSLLNTARLMDENPTLYRLKELEYVERIAEKVSSISLSSSGTLLDQLSAVVSSKKKDV
ncbi:MAG: slipin family protein [Spirochaetia bacterium]|nr:slipin family protein [Spirochaetia bacterium]